MISFGMNRTDYYKLYNNTCETNNLKLLKQLLKYKGMKDFIAADNNYALRYAAERGHLEIVKLLLEYPEVAKNIAADSNCALRWAADNGHLEVVRLLEDKIREVNDVKQDK